MYIDIGSLCLSLFAVLSIVMLLCMAKAFVDAYVLKRCDCPKEYDGSCIGGHQEYY